MDDTKEYIITAGDLMNLRCAAMGLIREIDHHIRRNSEVGIGNNYWKHRVSELEDLLVKTDWSNIKPL